MTPERWQQVNEVFHRALEREPGDRPAFLEQACNGDHELRREVESLIGIHQQSGSFIDNPALAAAAQLLAEEQPPSLVGKRLGHYDVLALVGAGGMGEVYRARDSVLKREVAVKVLPSSFAANPERLWRFKREARAASALNHPNIVTIHEISEGENCHFIVSELVEGQTLRQKVAGGRMVLGEALDVAIKVASALDAAHRAGIVHRDIKPENVMVRTDGLVKVLDFGLAKLTEGPIHTIPSDALSPPPTQTRPGMILGTVHYMSPEQARGQEVDERSDLFSLGVMLYEMLAGRRPFEGPTPSDVVAAILTTEPEEVTEINSKVAPQLERIVRRCLEKKPELRFQSASDLAFALEALAGSTGAAGTASSQSVAALPPPRRRIREHLPWLVATLLLLTAALFAALYFRRGMVEAHSIRFLVYPPEKGTFQWLLNTSSAISPDGQRLALVVTSEGRTQLYVRPLAAPDPQPLAGTEGAANPFWSPDSRSLGFFADGKLKRIEVSGGSPQTICDAPNFNVGTWGRNGTIVFVAGPDGSLNRVTAKGGAEPALLVKPDPAREEMGYAWPYFLPDGHHFLYLSYRRDQRKEVLIGALDSPDVKHLMQAESRAVYAPPGYLLYVRDGTLLAQAFDPDKLSLTGEPVTVAENLLYFQPLGSSDVSASDNGVLACHAGTGLSRLVWYSRDGAEVGTVGEVADYHFLRLSPDGQRLAVDIGDRRTGTVDVWVFDLVRGTSSRFTFDPGVEWSPVWSPDGRQIAFAADRSAVPNLNVKGFEDTGRGEQMVEPSSGWVQFPWDWAQTPQGQFIIYADGTRETGNDLMLLPLQGERKPRPFLRTKFDEDDARFSPDGRWVAYVSNESGRREVYLRPFEGSSEKWQISTAGGFRPRWRRDGKELFYLTAEGNIMAVEVKAGSGFEVGKPTPLFHVESARNDSGQYEVSADGQRFLVNSGNQTQPVMVVVNWAADLKR